MKIILRQDMPNLGKIGDIINVRDGYARNYLIPRELAFYATSGAMKAIEVEKKKLAKKIENELLQAEQLASKLNDLQISIPMKVGEEGKLYGSVSAQMISQELSQKGFEIDKRFILIDEAIKTLGVFDVKVKLHQDLTTTIKVWVISED